MLVAKGLRSFAILSLQLHDRKMRCFVAMGVPCGKWLASECIPQVNNTNRRLPSVYREPNLAYLLQWAALQTAALHEFMLMRRQYMFLTLASSSDQLTDASTTKLQQLAEQHSSHSTADQSGTSNDPLAEAFAVESVSIAHIRNQSQN